MFLVIFALMAENTTSDPPYYLMDSQLNTFLSIVAAIIVFCFITTVIINGCFPSTGIFPMFMDKRYPVYYTIYNLTFIAVLISLYSSKATPFILAGMSLLNIVVLSYWKPYPAALHNITIVIEQVLVMVALGFYIY